MQIAPKKIVGLGSDVNVIKLFVYVIDALDI
jgi:hypothetical protein